MPNIKEYETPKRRYQYDLKEEMKWGDGCSELNQQGVATKKTIFPGEEIMRPVSLRIDRADFCHQIFETRRRLRFGEIDNENYKRTIDLLRVNIENRDLVYLNFLEKVQALNLNVGELGVQMANYVDLFFEKTDFMKPPVVVIPGISNDLSGGGRFAMELALTGRRVILIAYPESWHGKTTKKFMQEVVRSENFEPHVLFFTSAIKEILGEETPFDICGISAGAVMASEIVKKQGFNQRIGSVNLVTPPGITRLNLFDIPKRIANEKEVANKQRTDGLFARLLVTNLEILKRSKEEIEVSEKTFRGLMRKLTKRYEWWKNLDKKTNVILCNKDGITYGIKNIKELRSNRSLSIRIIEGIHNTPAVEPKKIIGKMTFSN